MGILCSDPAEIEVPNFFWVSRNSIAHETLFPDPRGRHYTTHPQEFSFLQIILCGQRIGADSPKKKLDFIRNVELLNTFLESWFVRWFRAWCSAGICFLTQHLIPCLNCILPIVTVRPNEAIFLFSLAQWNCFDSTNLKTQKMLVKQTNIPRTSVWIYEGSNLSSF